MQARLEPTTRKERQPPDYEASQLMAATSSFLGSLFGAAGCFCLPGTTFKVKEISKRKQEFFDIQCFELLAKLFGWK
jgi:hypothetical protein